MSDPTCYPCKRNSSSSVCPHRDQCSVQSSLHMTGRNTEAVGSMTDKLLACVSGEHRASQRNKFLPHTTRMVCRQHKLDMKCPIGSDVKSLVPSGGAIWWGNFKRWDQVEGVKPLRGLSLNKILEALVLSLFFCGHHEMSIYTLACPPTMIHALLPWSRPSHYDVCSYDALPPWADLCWNYKPTKTFSL